VILITPDWFFDQEIALGNEFERHLSLWTPQDFEGLAADVYVSRGHLMAVVRGEGGTYPSDEAVKASRIVRRIPFVRDRGPTSILAKEAIRRLLPTADRAATSRP
jgi:hypothetical protein